MQLVGTAIDKNKMYLVVCAAFITTQHCFGIDRFKLIGIQLENNIEGTVDIDFIIFSKMFINQTNYAPAKL